MSITVSNISIYPIKSSAAIELSSSWLDQLGLSFDRRFVLTRPNGQFITARTEPKLCLIQTSLTTTGLKVSAPNMPVLTIEYQRFSQTYNQVQIWQDIIAGQHCLPEYDLWFSQYLGIACQLHYFGEQSQRQINNKEQPLSFADGYPLLLISQASLDELNSRLAQPVNMKQFRPNLVVDNCDAFAEDEWRHIQIGEVEFEVSKPCTRCVFTTINPVTGEFSHDQEPLTTLKQYRQDQQGEVCFGQNLIALNQGQINIGDKVTVLNQQNKPVFIAKQLAPVSKQTSEEDKAVNILFDSWDKQVKGNNQDTLLEQGEDAGLILPYSCRGGMCGSCKVKLESGEVKQLATDGLSEQEQEQGYVLACSSIPLTDVVINQA